MPNPFHVLNNYKVAMDLQQYNNRHDEVFRITTEFMKRQVPDDMITLADLTDQYQFPSSLTPSNLWPDLVVCSELTRTAIIIELTVGFETNFKEGNEKKESKYSELVEEVERIDFVVDLITVEVGLRGILNYEVSNDSRMQLVLLTKNYKICYSPYPSCDAIKGSFHI